jgi:hypothetical protein
MFYDAVAQLQDDWPMMDKIRFEMKRSWFNSGTALLFTSREWEE